MSDFRTIHIPFSADLNRDKAALALKYLKFVCGESTFVEVELFGVGKVYYELNELIKEVVKPSSYKINLTKSEKPISRYSPQNEE
jgi:hypothetical protein